MSILLFRRVAIRGPSDRQIGGPSGGPTGARGQNRKLAQKISILFLEGGHSGLVGWEDGPPVGRKVRPPVGQAVGLPVGRTGPLGGLSGPVGREDGPPVGWTVRPPVGRAVGSPVGRTATRRPVGRSDGRNRSKSEIGSKNFNFD